MTWLNRFNPTPAFPPYTGPYKVGSTEVEIPATDLDSPSEAPAPNSDLPTVAFRIFYPCQPDSQERGVRWIPSPQREYIGAYARFLGANSAFAHLFSVLPQLLYYISIPVHHNAQILEPTTKSQKWPVMIFSHGLGGSKNAYSHILGSLSSHGIVVIAPDHRDGSSPISFVHDSASKGKSVEYRKVAHKASTEVYESRDEQLRIRLWELGLIHDAVLKIDNGTHITNLEQSTKKSGGKDVLGMFSNLLDVHKPGTISWAGHSFGAATMIQFLKSVFYHSSESSDSNYRPLFTPSKSSALTQQITMTSPLALLDLWTLPLQSPSTSWLRSKPLPCYIPWNSRGGSSVVAILSEAFYKWSSNLNETKRAIAKPKDAGRDMPGPHIFYPASSAHLSQSDFGILFPWVTTKIFGAKEPERVLKLNTRAILQVLRNGGVEMADTSVEDLEAVADEAQNSSTNKNTQDSKILSRTKDTVNGWISLSTEPELELANGHVKAGNAEGETMGQGAALGEVVTQEQGKL